MTSALDRLARDVGREIENELDRLGILFRIFVRAKSEESVNRKLQFKKYDLENEKLMQDIIGIRITLYFYDDLPIIYQALKKRPDYLDETIDTLEETVFKPERVNLIFRLDNLKSAEVRDIATSKFKYIDNTFEVQLRTVLSEGWHEVDHDLRYKCSKDWAGSSDISRTFNGVYASLVTNDWSILSIFEKLAYRHYKEKNWTAMLRHKFRLRFREEELNQQLQSALNNNSNLAKQIFRTDRNDYIRIVFEEKVRIPLTFSNLVYLLNILFIKDSTILGITPNILLESFNKDKYPIDKL